MDVNQTRFHLVYGKADWHAQVSGSPADSPPQEPSLDWNDADATLSLHQELFIFPKPSGQSPLTPDQRRGAGRDRYGNWYWIGDGGKDLWFLGASKNTAEHFWSAANLAPTCTASDDPFTPAQSSGISDLAFCGLAVTRDHYLVVGLTQPKGLLIFDLHGGGAPLEYLWPASVAFSPFDMAPARDGGVWILDRINKVYWSLDRYLRVQAQIVSSSNPEANNDFVPVSGKLRPEQVQCYSRQITASLAISLAPLADPIAIEALPDGSVMILDNFPGSSFSAVYQYYFGSQTAPPLSLNHILAAFVPTQANGTPQSDSVRGHDIAFVPNPDSGQTSPGTLFIAGIDGEQVFAFRLKAQPENNWLQPLPRYLPMRRFSGKAIVAAAAEVYYDFEERWWPLVEQPRSRYKPEAELQLPLAQATASPDEETAFDGKQLGCIWHRLLLDACIPPGARVSIQSRAADQRSLLPAVPWQQEPNPYLRSDGSELPFYDSPLSGPADRVGTWELLFQNARGRYLQLKLTLQGTGRNTPRLHALRIWYPRFSYLRQYLPAVYRDDAASSSFLDRYLANIEGFYTVLEGKIEQVQTLFDTRTVPAEYLDWLASWVGLSLDLGWSESTRRLVLSHAPQMFFQRGTLAGMVRAIRLGLDACPDESLFQNSSCANQACGTNHRSSFSVRVVERFTARNAAGVVYGDPTDVLGPGSTTAASSWTPAQGAAPLHTLFREYLRASYSSIASLNAAWGSTYSSFDDTELILPPVRPPQKNQAADWRRFLREALGFTYAAVTNADLRAYRDFLGRQYAHIGDLNNTYGLAGTAALADFDQVQLPGTLPAGGRKLRDWIQFVSVVLPTARNAHRFTVLVPVTPSDDPQTQLTKLGIAERIAEIEKPAHTDFDTRLYWGMFRVGEARVGLDTLLGQGSRSVAIVLGRDYLAGGHLAWVEPWNLSDRETIGRSKTVQPCCGHRPQERCT
ncbi:MAG: beta-galactosidase [Acidobacteriia bacterium]|nr:beta-galactosidase [Terriglobia bacterium]